MTRFEVIFAAHEDVHGNLGIGRKGRLPWRIPAEMDYFRRKTMYSRDGFPNAVIMGRRTWDSLPHAPLPGRFNIVVTSTPIPYVDTAKTLREAMQIAIEKGASTAFIIGGKLLIEEALCYDEVRVLHMTRIHGNITCDTFVDRTALDGWTVDTRQSSNFHTYVDPRKGVLVYRFLHLIRFKNGKLRFT